MQAVLELVRAALLPKKSEARGRLRRAIPQNPVCTPLLRNTQDSARLLGTKLILVNRDSLIQILRSHCSLEGLKIGFERVSALRPLRSTREFKISSLGRRTILIDLKSALIALAYQLFNRSQEGAIETVKS